MAVSPEAKMTSGASTSDEETPRIYRRQLVPGRQRTRSCAPGRDNKLTADREGHHAQAPHRSPHRFGRRHRARRGRRVSGARRGATGDHRAGAHRRRVAAGARRVRGARRQRAHHGSGARRPCERRRARDGAIIAVGPGLAAAGAESIEGRGMICMPGFIDTHWHLWTSNLRPIVRVDDAERGYFPVTAKLGPYYTPQDSYRAVRLGLAEALSAGVTTVHNWAHNVRSPAHADAEVAAQRDMGVRGRFGYGTPQGLANEQPMDLVDLARLKRDLAGDPMISLGIASRNVGRDPNPLRGPVTME